MNTCKRGACRRASVRLRVFSYSPRSRPGQAAGIALVLCLCSLLILAAAGCGSGGSTNSPQVCYATCKVNGLITAGPICGQVPCN